MLPKVVPMDPLSGKPTSYALTPSEPAVVIPCPSCNTKFAVESSLIAAIEKPKFHCSRCDAVFGMPSALAKSLHSTALHATPPAHKAAEQHDLPLGEEEQGDGFEEESQQPESFVRDTYQPQEHKPTTGIRASDFSLAARSAQNDTVPVRESSPPMHQPAQAPQPSSPELPSSRFAPPEPAHETPRRSRYDIEELLAHSSRTYGTVQTAEREGASHLDRQVAVATHDAPSRSWRAQARAERPRVSGGGSSHWRGGALASMPLLATVTALIGFSYFTYLAPDNSSTVARAIFPTFLRGSQPQLPPENLVVKGLSVRFEKTQTKEVIPVIRGTLVNGGERELDGVVLQGLGFDRSGEVVLDARAPLRSALSREQIGELPLATVQKFQNSLSARSSSIKPGEQVAFTVALLSKRSPENEATDSESTLKSMRFFSARVFSTK